MIEHDHFDDFVDVFSEYKQTPGTSIETTDDNLSPD